MIPPPQSPETDAPRRLPRYTSYPAAPQFHERVDAATYRAWLQSIDPGAKASIYLHVPYCTAMCWYCGCHTTVSKGYGAIGRYVAPLMTEIDLIADAIPHRLSVSHIHWGGGTPNLLTAADVQRIMDRIAERFEIRPETEIAAELDPRTLDEARVAAFASCGMTRASIGVQDFDPHVQAAVNREQPYEMTATAVDLLRDYGVDGINLDLLYGLPHQTVDSLRGTIDRALGLLPDRVALFGYAHVPWMKTHQIRIPEDALPDAPTRRALCTTARAQFTAAGYRAVGIDHFARPGDTLATAVAAGALRRNFQGYTTDDAPVLLAFGASAIGCLPGGYVQNAADETAWRAAITSGRLATRRGHALSDDDRLRRAIIERLMCDLRVDLAAIGACHGVDPATFTPECDAVDDLAAAGQAWRDGWRIGVSPDAPELARAVSAVFDRYLPSSAARHSLLV